MTDQRFATAVIVGKPNVGKSSLLNALMGQKLALVSDKPQATRAPVIGILTTNDTQLMLVDEPGLLDPTYLLQRVMGGGGGVGAASRHDSLPAPGRR